MPGPLKNSAVNTTGLKIGKVDGKLTRTDTPLPSGSADTGDLKLDQYLSELKEQIQLLLNRVNAIENKLNHMKVDPVTHVVTFIV